MIFINLVLFLISISGIFLLRYKILSKQVLSMIIAIGAGVMIATSLVHVFPDVIMNSKNNALFFIGGFLFTYLIENILMVHSCVEHDCHYHNLSIISLVAICIHTFFDGLGIGAGLNIGEKIGYSFFISILIHQIPVSFSIAGLLSHSRFTKKVQYIMLILFGLSAPVGIILTFYVLKNTNIGDYSYSLLAIAGGSLLYIGASDLLPVIHKNSNNRWLTVIIFLFAAILTSLTAFLE
ncbi:MAG: ZIP family metal transporter [Candidatus Gracilibacteria bacterium]|nr:ZIP family metal transporter [Candidatus Gracilibacteria bacterium]